jgi:hypothetical protein
MMADTPDIPEAKDRFETSVAITIAVVAVILSWISNRGDDAKTSAIIKTNEASNKWGHFQSKSIKERLIETTLDLTGNLSTAAADGDSPSQLVRNLRSEVERYKSEKGAIEKEAAQLQEEAGLHMRINDRCGSGCLILQVAIVIASVAILARSKFLWIGSMLLAVVGSVIGISSHFM